MTNTSGLTFSDDPYGSHVRGVWRIWHDRVGGRLCNPVEALIDQSRLHKHPTCGLKSDEYRAKQPLILYCFHHAPTNFTTYQNNRSRDRIVQSCTHPFREPGGRIGEVNAEKHREITRDLSQQNSLT